mgnify:CR=1 FL=1
MIHQLVFKYRERDFRSLKKYGGTMQGIVIENKSNLYKVASIEKENGGLSSARNYGLKYAKGKYISFIDSDIDSNSAFRSALSWLSLCSGSYVASTKVSEFTSLQRKHLL